MKLRFALLAAVGVALALYLVRYVGWHAVLSAAATIGWTGFALFCLGALALFVLLGTAWQVLLPAALAPRLRVLIGARLVRDAGAEVLPLSQLGGIALGVRAAMLQGMSAALASASMIVDVTAEMLAQIAYAVLGVAILLARVPRSSQVTSLTSACVIGLLLAAVAAGLFITVQRRGGRITARLARTLRRSAGQPTFTGVGRALEIIYRSPARVVLSVALHLAAWVGNGAVVWLGFRLIGAHIDVAAAIAIESLVYAIRSAGAFVPNALGVQEGAYLVLGPLFGVPVLLSWQAAEGRRAFQTAVRSPAGDGGAQ